jgi:TonB-linked SusC/RagA family outer membrane protein
VPSLQDTLIFSFVGYQSKTIPINGRNTVNIALVSHVFEGQKLVVVGYGEQKNINVTTAISHVSGEEIRKTPVTALQNSFTGKLPGLFTIQRSGEPGGGHAAHLFVRGKASYVGNNQPLVLVDNVPYNYGQLFLIDPDVVKSVSVLKGAAASAIYGVKGANGVILVTTRRGKPGKPRITAKTQWGIQTPVHRYQTLDAYHTALLRNEALVNAGQKPKFTKKELELFKSGADPYGHPNINWNHVLFKPTALMQKENVGISGGVKRITYFINLGYQKQGGLLRDIPYKGTFPEPGLTKASQINHNYYAKHYKFRANLDIHPKKSLHFTFDLSGTHYIHHQPEVTGPIGHMYNYEYLNPYMYPIYNPNGTFGYANPQRIVPHNRENNMVGLVALGGYRKNLNDFLNLHVTGTQDLKAVTPGLSIKASALFSFANTATRDLFRAQGFPSFYYNPQDSSYTPRDPDVFRVSPYSLHYSGGTLNRRLNFYGSLRYKRSIGPHNVSGLFLYSQTSYIQGAIAPHHYRGFTFRATYNYKNKYDVAVSGAYNGSDRFITKRYALFPSYSVGWNIAGESFFKQLFPFINLFKIRASWAYAGDDAIGNFRYLYRSVYSRDVSYSFGETDHSVTSIVQSKRGNRHVTWQTERDADIGLDFSFFGSKLSGSFDYFDRYRYDILSRRHTVPLFFGVRQANLPPVNLGKVSDKGYEIQIKYNGRVGPVGLNISGNYSFAKNKILYKDEATPLYPYQKQTGHSIGTLEQYIWTGKFYKNKTDLKLSPSPPGFATPGFLKYKDLNGDGVVNKDDKAYVGYPNVPETTIGLTVGFDYKGFRFSMLLQSALRFDVYTGFNLAVPFKGDLIPWDLHRWTPGTASTATFPIMTTKFNGSYMSPRGNPSTFWTVSGNYLRIKSMNISYQIPGNIVNNIGLAGARIFINGRNLFTWSKVINRYQFDPEVQSNKNTFVYPVLRFFNFGLKLRFK